MCTATAVSAPVRRLAPGALACLVASGCTGAESGATEGPQITEVAPPYPEWSLDATPDLRIGAVSGPPELQFTRVAYAGRMSDGALVVVDGGSNEVRWFDPAGAFLFQAGGQGEGPGEFSRIATGTLTPQDTLVLYDSRNQRLTWFGRDGALVRTQRAEWQGLVSLTPLDNANRARLGRTAHAELRRRRLQPHAGTHSRSGGRTPTPC